jgi:hypothetical protein
MYNIDSTVTSLSHTWDKEPEWGNNSKTGWGEEGGLSSRDRNISLNSVNCQPYQASTALLERPTKLSIFENEKFSVTLSLPEMESSKMDAIKQAIFK